MKGIPKRSGEIVDLICREAGIKERVVPRSVALHKTEAISILEHIRGLSGRLKGEGEACERNNESSGTV